MVKSSACNLTFFLAFSLLSLLSLALSEPSTTVSVANEVKGLFVFGSSHVDNGNNNFLKNTNSKANYSPYGIDFPLGPSGRFSNGRNPIDVLGELLRLPCFIPPFADPRTSGSRIVYGVNYASGGSGILDETGAAVVGEVVSLSQQIRNFENRTLPNLEKELRARSRSFADSLSRYLFVFGTGVNDYLLNYFLPGNEKKPVLSEFTEVLVSKLTQQIKKLYMLGARKFVLLSIQPMGCIPAVRALPISNGSCIESLNEAALLFNNLLRSQVLTLKDKMPGSNLVFVNSYSIMRAIIDNPYAHGFSDASRACCEHKEGDSLCKKDGIACNNRRSHVYFDGIHPTDVVNLRIAQKAYSSNLMEDVHPFNVKKLFYMQ